MQEFRERVRAIREAGLSIFFVFPVVSTLFVVIATLVDGLDVVLWLWVLMTLSGVFFGLLFKDKGVVYFAVTWPIAMFVAPLFVWKATRVE